MPATPGNRSGGCLAEADDGFEEGGVEGGDSKIALFSFVLFVTRI
jgi:hypothetical protein